MKKIITIASIKGGVGKTTLGTFLSQAIAAQGRRVLVIDADPNNNLTDYFLRDYDINDIEQNNLYHFIKTGDPTDSIYTAQLGLDIIPCTLTLHKIGLEMAGRPAGMVKFKKALEALEYDTIVIDTPPSLSYEFRTALHAADMVLTPVNFSRWTLQAFMLLQDELQDLDSAAQLQAVPSIVTEAEDDKLRRLDFQFTDTSIKKMAAIKNANDKGAGLKNKAWENFMKLAGEI